MKDEHKRHLALINAEATHLISTKYTKGVKEHGGKLWEKRGLIDMAIDEAVDQVVYLLTLKHQIEKAGVDDLLGEAYETQ